MEDIYDDEVCNEDEGEEYKPDGREESNSDTSDAEVRGMIFQSW